MGTSNLASRSNSREETGGAADLNGQPRRIATVADALADGEPAQARSADADRALPGIAAGNGMDGGNVGVADGSRFAKETEGEGEETIAGHQPGFAMKLLDGPDGTGVFSIETVDKGWAMTDFRSKVSVDWWSVIAALTAAILVKVGVFSRIPW